MTASYGVILLAAGGSFRLGEPKQLLPYQGKTLLEHALQAAAALRAASVLVLGANADRLLKMVSNKAIETVVNDNWEEGMASSIRVGLRRMLDLHPDIKGIICMVCDQPFVTEKLLEELLERYYQTGKPIIASGYSNTIGTPAFFDNTVFSRLLELKGDEGAKRIMKENPEWVDIVDFPAGNIDIDTQSDYEALATAPCSFDDGEKHKKRTR
jgi:molybdenum cofactor cytidylyltransferase